MVLWHPESDKISKLLPLLRFLKQKVDTITLTRLLGCKLFPALLLVSGFFITGGLAQNSEDELKRMRQEVESLKEGQEAIRKSVRELKTLVQSGQQGNTKKVAPSPAKPFEPVDFDITGRPSLGSRNAELTFVEFSDYQCPVCARHARDILPPLVEEFVDTGLVKYVFFDYPLEGIHKQALLAAMAANCANEQGMFWEMHDLLFAHPRELKRQNMNSHAEAIGLDVVAFALCLDSRRYESKVRKGAAIAAEQAGAHATPHFGIGWTNPENPDEVRLVATFTGVSSYGRVRGQINKIRNRGPEKAN